MGIMELFSSLVIAVLGSCVLFLYFRLKNLRGPPCIQGWIPWFGAGFEFGKAPLEFIEKARIKYGPIFTVFAMGNRMTFVTEEEGIDVFLKSKHVDFELAVQNAVYHTARIPKNVFLTLHERLYVLMKGKMGTFSIHQFIGQLTEEIHEQLEDLGTHGTMDLDNFVRHLLYPATVNTLFKKGLFLTDERKIKEFYQHFKTYDDSFEYGSQLPEWLLRNWSKSKRWLLALFEKNIEEMKAQESAGHSGTLVQAILDTVEMESCQHSPNYGLLILWASLANAPLIAFWTLGFVLSHPDIHRTILEGIASVFGTAELGSTELTRGVHSPVSTVKKGQAGTLTHALSPSAGTFPDFKFSGFLLFGKYKARTGMVGMMWRAQVAQRPQLDCDVSVGLEFGTLTRGSSVKR